MTLCEPKREGAALKRKIKSMISVLWSLGRFSLLKLWKRGNFSFHLVERFSPNTRIDFIRGTLRLGNRVRAHHGTKLLINGGALQIGDDVGLNDECGIYCFDSIRIGARVGFGPRVMIYDHDHDFRSERGWLGGKMRTAPVVIGDDVWIGTGTVILRGTTIGDGSVIGAGCVVRGNIPPHTVLVQKREEELRPI